MRIGWGARVALGAILPVLLAMGAFLLLSLDRVGDQVRGRVMGELRSEVRMLAETLPASGYGGMLDRLAGILDARITIIGADGGVRYDSESDVSRMENHATRPELVEAREGGVAVVQRYSRTVKRELIYAAARLSGGRGFVRLARDESSVEGELARIARTFWFVAAGVVAVGALFALVFAKRVTRPLMRLTEAAVARARGDHPEAISPVGGDEVARLGEAFNEMTERLDETIAAAKSEAARLLAILGGMSEGVVAVDAEERIAFHNRAAERILGLQLPVEGDRLYQHVREPRILDLVQAVAKGGEPLEAEISHEGPPRRMIQVYVAPAGTDVIIVLGDLSRMRRLERMRTDFVSSVSHELRTPLASIAAAIETLEDPEVRADPETGPRFLAMMKRNATRLEALLDDILALSRFESRPETFERVPLDFAGLTRAAAEEFKERARREGIDLVVEADSPVPVRGNAEALRRILDNLVVNAITYTPAGGRVEVGLRRDRGDALLEVADTGIGIPEADRERVFQRFYRVDKGRSRGVGGTGLGLAIVKHAVGFHGGEVSVEGREGGGSRFTVRLPLGGSDQEEGGQGS